MLEIGGGEGLFSVGPCAWFEECNTSRTGDGWSYTWGRGALGRELPLVKSVEVRPGIFAFNLPGLSRKGGVL